LCRAVFTSIFYTNLKPGAPGLDLLLDEANPGSLLRIRY
jgi:hypothetical protein